MPDRFAKMTCSFKLQVSTQTTKLCLSISFIDKNVALRISRNSDIHKAFMRVNFTTTLAGKQLVSIIYFQCSLMEVTVAGFAYKLENVIFTELGLWFTHVIFQNASGNHAVLDRVMTE